MRRLPALLVVVLTLAIAGCSSSGRSPAPRATPSASGSSSSASPPGVVQGRSASSRFRIPSFPPAPTPVRIKLPAGRTPYLHSIPTTQKVAFLTIDDGFTKTAVAPELIAAANIPVTLFLTQNAIKDNPGYFTPMLQHGAVIEDHTITHTELRGKSYAYQRHEICGSADYLTQQYHKRPVLFRPPFGDKDATTLKAAHDCGMQAAFMWKETVDKGIVRYQGVRHIRSGDIILMHFRPAFEKDFLAALNAIHRDGLTPALLSDYLPATTG